MNMSNLLKFMSRKLQNPRLLTLITVLFLCVGVQSLGRPQTAQAAEKVVLTYGMIGRSISVDDLETFAETGRQTPTIHFLVKATQQNPDQVRQLLNQQVTISPKLLDNLLNILPGEYALFQAGQLFHTPARLENGKALRSALILSTANDRKISILEFLRKYPTREFYVDGYRLTDTAGEVIGFANRVGDRLAGPIAIAADLLEDLVCDCKTPSRP